jgi:tRNA (adenine37-N6)-methyltransferase
MSASSQSTDASIFQFAPIGFMQTCFSMKNGTGRQGAVCPHAKGILPIKTGSGCDEHLLDGLAEFSHVIVLWVFSDNRSTRIPSKVRPPRATGKVGCLATRSPHRPNEIGLSVCKLDRVDADTATLHLSGVDLVCGTPVLDVKPYVQAYDGVDASQYREAAWLRPNGAEQATQRAVHVSFADSVVEQVRAFVAGGVTRIYDDAGDLLATAREVLEADPRSRYRKGQHRRAADGQCGDGDSALLDYPFMIDTLNFMARFAVVQQQTSDTGDIDDAATAFARVVSVQDWSHTFDGNVEQQREAAAMSAANSWDRALKISGAVHR